ncbi:MAG: hypothetical protein QF570_08305 [Myxococcota bacterium]|jgi:hypothetical protein|nr:hypothetical protein [Myxococcota bacterium]
MFEPARRRKLAALSARALGTRLGCALALLTAFASTSSAQNCIEPGCDPSEITEWSTSVVSLVRGPVDLMIPALGYVTHGDPLDIPGAATGIPTDAVSLGDGGSVTVQFATPFRDGPDFDFAVFENGISSGGGLLYMELGFVEVSSNGVDFARMPTLTSRVDPLWPLQEADPDDYAGFAGHREVGTGSEFDLSDLLGHPLEVSGDLDLQAIAYVRIIDVIGNASTYDSMSNPVHDPYPTQFLVGGMDIDAVGAIYVPEPGFAWSALVGALFLRTMRQRRA